MIRIILAVVFILTGGMNLFGQIKKITPDKRMMPDAMNKVHYLDGVFGVFKGSTFDADSFPTFPGYPKIISGQSFEGGIVCQMDADSDLEIVYGAGSSIHAWNIDGSGVAGWPATLSFNCQGAPAYGDIDGDGQAEIVMGTSNFTGTNGAVYAYELNGTAVSGFPIPHGAASRTIVLSDLDNNGRLEIITNKRLGSTGEVWVYSGTGTAYPGWPKPLNHVPASSSAVGDITGDGIPEIVAESYLGLYAWDRNGNILSGFPYLMPNGDVNSYSSPVLADVDGDNLREIIFGTHVTGSGGGGYLYVLKNNGTVLNNFPKQTAWWIYGPPVLGYINDDNIIDIIVGDQIGSGIPTNYVYGWDKNGNSLPGFPIGPINAVNNQVLLADLDNDSRLELFIDDNTQTGGMGKYLCYNHDGTLNADWTFSITGTSFFNMPSLADVNRDGRIDLIGAGFTTGSGSQTYVYAWNTNLLVNTASIVNPVWQFNVRHNGVYDDNELVGINALSEVILRDYELMQNYPNPFNPSTVIKYRISKSANVELSVHSVDGRLVSSLSGGRKEAGEYSEKFEGNDLATGVYFYTLSIDGVANETRAMLFMK